MTMISEGTSEWSILGGGLGYHLALLSNGMFGWGTFLILILSLFVFIIFYFNVTSIPLFVRDPKPMGNDAILPDDKTEHEDPLFSNYTDDEDNWPEKIEPNGNEVKFETPMELKTVKEPVKPVKEVKLEVQKVEPVRTEPIRKRS